MGYEKFSLPDPWDATPNKLQYVDGDPSATTTLLAGRFKAGMFDENTGWLNPRKTRWAQNIQLQMEWHGAPVFLAENNYPMILRILGFFSFYLLGKYIIPGDHYRFPNIIG